MRNPKDFFEPLAVGAPAPLREVPVRLLAEMLALDDDDLAVAYGVGGEG